MKYTTRISVFAIFCIGIVECTTQKKIDYDIPQGLSETNQTEFVKQFSAGKTLYDLSCAKCHNTKVGRKKIVPDFSPQQLEKYNMKFRSPQHMNELKSRNVSDAELRQIFFYLKYKKKNTPTA